VKRWLIISNDDLELEYQYKKNIKLDENILDVGEFTKYKNMFGDTKDIELKTENERVKGKIVIGKEFERTQKYITRGIYIPKNRSYFLLRKLKNLGIYQNFFT